MIGKLRGIVDSIHEDHCILDVNGVGYLVHCPSSTLSRLTAGSPVSLMIETRVSEDAIRLYGFAGAEEREWFRLLQTVQNVGARAARDHGDEVPVDILIREALRGLAR
jgi:Holliday junction DNA helicase RuvA